MILKGVVTSVETNGVRVTFPDRGNKVSGIIAIATHVGTLEINNEVVVAFFNVNMTDGLVIAKF